MKKILSLIFAVLFLLSCGTNETLAADLGGIGNSDSEMVQSQSYGALAVNENFVWQVADGEIRVTDIASQQITARLPLSAIYSEQENYLAIISYGGNVQLCVAWNSENDGCRVTIYDLKCENNVISSTQNTDVSDSLRFLFEDPAKWNEVNMVACAQGIYIAALDEKWELQMYVFRQETGDLLSIGSIPFYEYNAVVPFGENLLLVGSNISSDGSEDLIRIKLPGGERELLRSLASGSLAQPLGYAFCEENQLLYYFLDNIGYRLAVSGESKPEPFCTLPENVAPTRYGAIQNNQYMLLNYEGNLIFRDATASLSAEPVRILDFTGAETIQNTVSIFNTANPDALAALFQGEEAEQVLDAVLSQSADYDAFAIGLGSNLYKTMKSRGYLGDMSGSETLKSAIANLPETIRNAATDGDKLLAFPVSVTNTSLVLNVPAMMKMTGYSEEQLPTDWTGLLQLLRMIAEQNLLETSQIVLLDEGLDVQTIKGTFFSWIIQDLMLWLDQDDSRVSQIQAVLTPVLQAFEQVPWENFGDDSDSNWMESEEEPASLILETEPEIAVMALDPGMQYWPLSLAVGGERLTGQSVDALILNPYSAHADTVIRYAETIWKNMDIINRMELDKTMKEPVVNETLSEDLAFFEQQIELIKVVLAGTSNEQEKAELQANLKELEKFTEDYRQNAGWLVSEDSIAFYRSLEPMLALRADEFWSEGAEDIPVLQFLDGMMPAAQFVNQLASAIQMSRMEGN